MSSFFGNPMKSRDELSAAMALHRQTELNRMGRPRPKTSQKQSQELQVYVYNVGPFRHVIPMASYGTAWIPALDLKKVLDAEMSVSAPYIVAGVPSESYPGVVRNDWKDHEVHEGLTYFNPLTQENEPMDERPGVDFALRLIGGHQDSKSVDDITSQGVFMSLIPAPPGPKPKSAKSELSSPAFIAAMSAWEHATEIYESNTLASDAWDESVRNARAKFQEWSNRELDEASQLHSRGQYAPFNILFEGKMQDRNFILARILKKTPAECVFLQNTTEASARKACLFCKGYIPMDAIKCNIQGCGEKQLPEDEYNAEVQRLLKAASAKSAA